MRNRGKGCEKIKKGYYGKVPNRSIMKPSIVVVVIPIILTSDSLDPSINVYVNDILEQLPTIKECIREAAFFTRDSLNFLDSGGRENRRLTLESISRAVWNEDVGLARKLLDTTKLAREHIKIAANRINILDPPAL